MDIIYIYRLYKVVICLFNWDICYYQHPIIQIQKLFIYDMKKKIKIWKAKEKKVWLDNNNTKFCYY